MEDLMKKTLAVAMALLMCFAVFASGSAEKEAEKSATTKIGFVVIGDENDQGYTYNFMKGMNAAIEKLTADGYDVKLSVKRNIKEDAGCVDANIALAAEGCEVIFDNSYGFEQYMQQAADEFPKVKFISLTNCNSQIDGRDNTYNAFARIYEGRYIAGVAAGMKLQEMIDTGKIKPNEAIVGYVGAFSFAEVISGMSAYYLGIRSVCPTATMKVQFVGSWSDPTLEAEAAQALIDVGAVMISQHSDNTTPATTAQKNGVFHTGYNNDMTGVAPNASLLSCRIDWTKYFYTYIANYIDGKENPHDYVGTMGDGEVVVTELNTKIAAPGTQEAMEKAEKAIADGSLQVFDLSKFTIGGKTPTNADMYDSFAAVQGNAVHDSAFHESELQSAPYFVGKIDGIEWLNAAY